MNDGVLQYVKDHIKEGSNDVYNHIYLGTAEYTFRDLIGIDEIDLTTDPYELRFHRNKETIVIQVEKRELEKRYLTKIAEASKKYSGNFTLIV